MFGALIFLTLLVQALSQSCPSKQSVHPCTCENSKTGDDPSVNCEGLTSANGLLKPIASLQNKKVSSFYIEKSNIGQLPADIFRGVEIKSLTITFTNLTSLGQLHTPPFLGLEKSLEELEIRESFIDENNPLSVLSLSHLKKLSLLLIDSNQVPVIGNEWFESGPYGLRELFLIDVYTQKLGSHAFSTLSKLTKFTLTGSKIASLARSMFPNLVPSLEAFDFSDNQLTSLPKDIFYRMPSLKEVYLDNNALNSIDEVAWAPVWGQMEHVHLLGNTIICDKDIKWIYFYRLPEFLTGECAQPEILKTRNLTSLTLANFD